ncbi:MAG: LCP family protein [Chloroflexi bacterium]|nr:LCP family protein [Chloroflexota bacterium]
MTSSSPKRRPQSRIQLPIWAIGILGIILLVILVGSSIWLFRTVREMTSAWEVTNPDFGSVEEPGTPDQASNHSANAPESNNSSLPINLNADSVQPWSGQERVTILMLGIDQRCEEDGPTHTDSMMLVTVDPVGLSAGILSLPRDMWVEIPSVGVDRINQANYYGEIYNYPGGGPALAVDTVEAFLGVKIDYYAAVNFDAFVEIVDQIGGIDIVVPEAITDETYPDRCYGYDPFQIEAGDQHLDGQTALKYARTRATFGGDVDRAGRQQAVVLAVRDRVLSLNMLPSLITKAPALWQTLQDNVRTDMSLEEAMQLALLVQEIPRSSIHTSVIDYDYVYAETTPDGRQVLVPNRDNIRQLRNELFTAPAIPTPEIQNLPALMAAENARVAVLNGTPVFGLAGDTEAFLKSQNINVAEIGNADAATYRTTQIIDYGDHPNTQRFLIQLMGIPPLNVSSGSSPDGDYDLLIILGSDWHVPGQ